MARVAGSMFGAGMILTLLGIALPRPEGASVAGFALVAVLYAIGALLMFTLGRRLPFSAFPVAIGAGTLVVTMLIFLRTDSPTADTTPLEMGYVWSALYSAYFFSRRETAAQIVLAAAAYALPLLALSPRVGVGSWVVTVLVLGVLSAVVFALRARGEREIAGRQQAADELELSLSLLQATLESTADGLLVADDEGRIVTFNNGFLEMWGIPAEIAQARDDKAANRFVLDQLSNPGQFMAKVDELYTAPDVASFDVLELKDGRVIERYSQPQRLDGRTVGRVWSFRDVTERRDFVEQLQKLADHDSLTGLINRRRFEEELSREVAAVDRYETTSALLVIDIDNFKLINDGHGHVCGDQTLREMAAILQSRVRRADLVGRLGGDEFAILLPRIDAAGAETVARELRDAIGQHRFAFHQQQVRVTASIGVVPFAGGEDSGTELLINADLAMYAAKESGRDRVQVHSLKAGGHSGLTARIDWSKRIRAALDDDGFVLHAQPVFDLDRRELTQYELLARMPGDNGELIPPGAFLGVAARLSMIQELDRWVAREAIRLLAAQQRAGRNLRLEVNVSGQSIDDPQLSAVISNELADTGVDPANLILALTESSAIANIEEARRFAGTLRRLGCRFALDNFGSGLGSIHHLKLLPVDFVKIAGEFVRNLPRSSIDQVVVASMVQIANGFGVLTVAEAVQDDETIEVLRRFGVNLAQGNHLGKPQPLEQALAGPQSTSEAQSLLKPG